MTTPGTRFNGHFSGFGPGLAGTRMYPLVMGDSPKKTIRFDLIRFSTTNFSLLILIELICEARNLTIAMLVLTVLCLDCTILVCLDI